MDLTADTTDNISVTSEMRKLYYTKELARTLVSFTAFTSLYAAAVGALVLTEVIAFSGLSTILNVWMILSYVGYMIVGFILYHKVIVPLIWRHTIEINIKQFETLGGKLNIPPPDRFSDIWKYEGELDFDFVLSEFNGIRTSRKCVGGMFTLRFRREEDVIHFKLFCPHF